MHSIIHFQHQLIDGKAFPDVYYAIINHLPMMLIIMFHVFVMRSVLFQKN